jgi:hypothetical protein
MYHVTTDHKVVSTFEPSGQHTKDSSFAESLPDITVLAPFSAWLHVYRGTDLHLSIVKCAGVFPVASGLVLLEVSINNVPRVGLVLVALT